MFDSQLFVAILGIVSAIVGGAVGGWVAGRYSLRAVDDEFRRQRELVADEESLKQKGARFALIAEMAENNAKLDILAKQAEAGATISGMVSNLKLSRYALDTYMPLIALGVRLADIQTILATYSAPSLLLATLEGQWREPGYGGPSGNIPSKDRDALKLAAQNFRAGLFAAAAVLLTAVERVDAGLEQS
jgi:hypothetical protein